MLRDVAEMMSASHHVAPCHNDLSSRASDNEAMIHHCSSLTYSPMVIQRKLIAFTFIHSFMFLVFIHEA